MAKKKKPVLENLPASGSSELVAGETAFGNASKVLRTRIFKAILRVKGAIAHELIDASMKRVGARTRDRIDHATGSEAVFRRVAVGQYRKLLNRVHTCVSAEYVSRTCVGIVVDDHAVEPVDVLLGPSSPDGHLYSHATLCPARRR